MHELNILSHLRLARFLLTEQLIYKSKIEKHKNQFRYFCIRHQCSIAGNLHVPADILASTDTPLFGSDISICVVCPSEVHKKCEYQQLKDGRQITFVTLNGFRLLSKTSPFPVCSSRKISIWIVYQTKSNEKYMSFSHYISNLEGTSYKNL